MSTEEKDQAKQTEQENEHSQETVPLEEAQNKAGIRDAGTNQEAVESVSEEAQNEVMPSFFVEEDDLFRIEIDVLFDKETGKIVSVSRKGAVDPSSFELLGHTEEWFDFLPVSYEKMSNYRQRSSVYRRDAGKAVVDPVALRNYFVVWHLKDWSMRDRKGNPVKLTHNDKGALDDKSIDAVYKVAPTMLDVVLTHFEKDMMM